MCAKCRPELLLRLPIFNHCVNFSGYVFQSSEILLVFGLVVLLSSCRLLSVSATGEDMQGFYKDAKSMEERAHQGLEKARKVAEEKEARLVVLRALGDRAS